jgi:LPXTG-site transpeptidase (sortase) family protein
MDISYLMIISKYLTLTSILLFCGGLLLATPTGISLIEQQQALATTPTIIHTSPIVASDPTETVVTGTPIHISVPSVNIDVDIANGVYNPRTATWTLTENTAFFASITNPANNIGGNTFIYGHDSTKIFGNLRQIKASATATITTANGYVFVYTFVSTEKVEPSDVAVLNYNGTTPRLTLQTCPGVPNLTRQIFYFDFTSYSKV